MRPVGWQTKIKITSWGFLADGGQRSGLLDELINPALDNSLGGSWRASVQGNPAVQGRVSPGRSRDLEVLKGTSEAFVAGNGLA